MYFDDEISLAELCRGPVYRAAAVRAYLERAKAAYDRERVAETSP
jgi:hypothetical protein